MALLAVAALSACGQDGAPAADPSRPLTAHRAAVTSGAGCPETGVHGRHLNLFACDTCHPAGATFGFDLPYTFAGGTTTAGGTIAPRTATTPTTCTVACHFPRGAPAKSVAWTTPGPLACTECHATSALPTAHPAVSANATRAECERCHVLGSHMDGAVTVVGHDPSWKDPASPQFHAPAANAGLAGCQGCHGQDLAGGAARVSCAQCHDVGLPAGVASWKVSCVMCHGGVELANGAPPKTTWGNGSDPIRTGAHTRHLTPSDTAPAADCAACHPTPPDVFAAGHLDGGTAEVAFGRAVPGATQSWDRATATCSNTYCHAGVAGGTRPAPVWTNAGQGDAACGACHGLPPPAPHPNVSGELAGCVGCHAYTMAAPGVIIRPAEGGLHLNGSVEATGGHPAAFKDPASPEFHAYAANRDLSVCQGCHGAALDGVGGSTTVSCASCHGAGFTSRCTDCHGGLETAGGAPPRPTWGGAGDPLRSGAHTRHVLGGAIGGPVVCDTCHEVPADALSPGHLGDAFAEVRFAGLATASGAAPAWDRAAGSCSASYCHGTYSGTYQYWWWEELVSVPYARTGTSPSWTGGPMTCTSCHGSPPPGGNWHSGQHGFGVTGNACSTCHPGVDAAGTAILDRTRHLNGVVDVQRTGSGCSMCH